MKKKSICLFLFLFTHVFCIYAQQISTDNTQQPNTLIQNLVGSSCASASNVSSSINGSVNNIISYGTFNNETSNFPFQNGLVLSTGSVAAAGNNLIATDLSEGNIDWATDPDLETITGITQTLNATSIEFDFESVNNFLSFKYIFASDEYQQEYPCNFKDVFAILIKRAGTSDPYINIATIADTAIEISTNTIHPNINGFCESQNDDYFDDYNIGDTNYNGRTEILTARADIIPNTLYHIKLIIADHIDQRFDSAVFIDSESFGNAIDLGPDQSICGSDLTLNADINNTAATYTWFLNGNVILGETNSTLEVNESGTYDVEVLIPSTNDNCILNDSIEIEITPYQDAAPIEDITICDVAPGDGLYDFDFSLLKDDEIYAALPSNDYTLSYHLSIEDAQANTNPITGLFQNTDVTHTIFVRIESLTGDCLQLGSFNISVYNAPNTYELTLDICNYAVADIGLASFFYINFAVSNFEFYTTVSYYLTENDAINLENELSEFPNFENEPSTMYARVQSILNPCASIVPIHLNYLPQPDIGRYIINDCLSPNLSETINGITYNYNNLPVTYNIFDLFDELEAEFPEVTANLEMLIAGIPPTITTTNNSTEIAISIRFVEENCPTYMTIEIHKNLLFNLLEKEKIIERCDDNSNDGIYDMDLSELILELKDGFEIDLSIYATEEDRNLQVNPLDENSIFTLEDNQSLYIASSYEGCTHSSKITLNLSNGLNIQPQTIDYCGSPGIESNTTMITIPPLKDSFLQELEITGPVEFFNNFDDAENQENEITDNYEIIENQHVFYVRMTNIFTGCYNITTLQVNITNVIEINNPEPLIICDDDQDLITTVNLEDVIPILSNNLSNLTFTFFESYDSAIEDESKIDNLINYTTSTTTLYIRAEDSNSECFSIIPYDILVYANPQLIPIPDFINCVIDPNQPSEFFFIDKDIQVIRNQTNMQVLYFESEENAINNIDPIDKTIGYLPSSNPQTIFVRLENADNAGCFKVAPMQIEIRQAPIYNNPTDVLECDINNTGLATTDLNEKIIEISENSPTDLNITFHLSEVSAEANANPLPVNFTATNNPQILYTRIENAVSGCFEIKPIRVSTLALPEVKFGKSLIDCADNYNYTQEWDLTEIELDILDGRQYNVDFSYFE
ncbi:hypothetical protein HNV10_16990, partial [Winogradskyella litoriviva]